MVPITVTYKNFCNKKGWPLCNKIAGTRSFYLCKPNHHPYFHQECVSTLLAVLDFSSFFTLSLSSTFFFYTINIYYKSYVHCWWKVGCSFLPVDNRRNNIKYGSDRKEGREIIKKYIAMLFQYMCKKIVKCISNATKLHPYFLASSPHTLLPTITQNRVKTSTRTIS